MSYYSNFSTLLSLWLIFIYNSFCLSIFRKRSIIINKFLLSFDETIIANWTRSIWNLFKDLVLLIWCTTVTFLFPELIYQNCFSKKLSYILVHTIPFIFSRNNFIIRCFILNDSRIFVTSIDYCWCVILIINNKQLIFWIINFIVLSVWPIAKIFLNFTFFILFIFFLNFTNRSILILRFIF